MNAKVKLLAAVDRRIGVARTCLRTNRRSCQADFVRALVPRRRWGSGWDALAFVRSVVR